ncbi:hypothetical protein B0H10DRAFT_2019087 [Mycena sp. CBHHK59/15]|nr:hypothetical protein B0H10DRAFT_2019087 [Mycena sp. CBHHK59/15]
MAGAPPQFAFVTLLTSDAYLPGALALAGALKDVHPSPAVPPEVDFQTVCLVTPESVDVSTIKRLRRAYNVVVGVEIIAQEDDKGLKLLGRLDLNTVLTKLHVFRLTQYSKIIFLDADVLPIRPLSHLFTTPHEFSAVPDVGWPDIFNSGVLVLSPGEDKFTELNELLKSKGSWDGGDQGVLNEWRGGNWNRLSFTYNTTPTAAYTYAPAYERFGSQISAIHFIGPNKPWNSLTYRPPFQSHGTQTDSGALQAYDYNALVDRWFAVYDKYCRAQPSISESEFEVKRYGSAWDEQTGIGSELISGSMASGTVLGLEDLRRIAIEGMVPGGPSSDSRSGEGEYTRMPLEGRVDLMRPQKEEKRAEDKQVEESRAWVDPGAPSTPRQSHPARSDSPPRWETLPTPGPDEVPSSPRLPTISLPRTPTPASMHADTTTSSKVSLNSRNTTTSSNCMTPSRINSHKSSSLNSHSSTVQQPQQQQPQQQQQPPQQQHTTTTQNPLAPHPPYAYLEPSTPPTGPCWIVTCPDSSALFQPPPPSEIPESLRRQGHYRQVTGDDGHGATPSPDRSKVKHVFPWEEKPRQMPAVPGTPESVALPRPQQLSPLHGLPATLTYANAWDTVPSIQKYASRLVRAPQSPPPLAPAFEGDRRWKRRSWEDRTEASSMDGDDEDEGDDDDDSLDDRARGRATLESDDDQETRSSTTVRSRSGSSSISASYTIKGKKKEYRVRGVQTISPQMRSQGTQVAFDPPKVTAHEKKSSRHDSSRRQWPPTASDVLPPVTAGSPREFLFSSPTTARPSVQTSTPPPPPPPAAAPVERQTSNDGSLTSPPSSIGPMSPPDAPLAVSPTRKGSRVWDPARGVELFKRGSEEVLARFLKMGSWEDENVR